MKFLLIQTIKMILNISKYVILSIPLGIYLIPKLWEGLDD